MTTMASPPVVLSSSPANAVSPAQQPATPVNNTANANNNADPPINDNDDSEYHPYLPLETRELSPTEQLWLDHAIEGRIDGLKALLPRVDIDCCDVWGSTALMHCCLRRHRACVEWLLDKGADMNKQDYRGITCLMEACWNRHIEMARLLLSKGADPNLCDERDYTSLTQSAEEGHADIVQLLIEARVDLNKQDRKRQYTALMWAVVEGHMSVVQLLVQANADLNRQDKYGYTALMQAVRTRLHSAVVLLVASGAEMDCKDKKGRTINDLGNPQTVQAIEKGKRELKRRYSHILSTEPFLAGFTVEMLSIISGYLLAVNTP